MNIYKISQEVNIDWDTYDSAVVYAESEQDARAMHPAGRDDGEDWDKRTWASQEDVKVEFLGTVGGNVEPRVIVASFNAG